MTGNLFVYGTLMADEVLIALLNRAPKRRTAFLRGYVRGTVRGESYPGIMPSPKEPTQDHKVEGLLIEDLSSRELRALDYYEDDDYERVEVTVQAANEELVPAMVYLFAAARRGEIDLDHPWSLRAFREERLEAFLREEVVPCAAAFNEEESAWQRQRQRRIAAISAAVTAGAACAVAYMRRSH